MLEKAITKWWFYVIVLLIAFIPSITQKSVPPEQTPLIIQEVLQNPLAYKYSIFFRYLKYY
jgi:cyanate permease